jgi:hypothetical protein
MVAIYILHKTELFQHVREQDCNLLKTVIFFMVVRLLNTNKLEMLFQHYLQEQLQKH